MVNKRAVNRGRGSVQYRAVQCTARSAEAWYLMRLASRPTARRAGHDATATGQWSLQQ